jgi:hypothetical protein
MSTAYFERLVEEDLDCGDSTATKRNPGGGTLSGTQVSLSTFSLGQNEVTATWQPGTAGVIANQSSSSTTITVTGARAGDKVLASLTTLTTAAFSISAHVSANDTVTVVISNLTGSSTPTIASGTLSVLVFAHR